MKDIMNAKSEVVEINPDVLVANESLEPMDWHKFATDAHLTGTPIETKELIGKTFDILRAKKFKSTFEKQEHAWYCVVRPVGQDEVFSTTLGGQAVMEIIDMYAKTGHSRPLRVTLDFVEGGAYGGYYQFK